MTLVLPKVSGTLLLVSLVVLSSSEAVSAAAPPARAAGVAAFFVPTGRGSQHKSSCNGRWRPSSTRPATTKTTAARTDPRDYNGVVDLSDSTSSFQPLLRLASAHCASQALCAAIQLDIPNRLWDREMNVAQKISGVKKKSGKGDARVHAFFVPLHDIASSIGPSCHVDTLLRMMRLLTTIDIVEEIEIPTRQEQGKDPTILGSSSSSSSRTETIAFRLTRMGRSLTTTKTTKTTATSPSLPTESSSVVVSEEEEEEPPSMASCFLHWMERPLWNSWLELSDFIRSPSNEVVPKNDLDDKEIPQTTTSTSMSDQTTSTTTTIQFPFERANDGISSDFWYNKEDHPKSLFHANQFVKLIHQMELQAVVDGYDWSSNCLDQQNRPQRIVDIGGHHGQLLTAIASSTMAKAPKASVEWFSLDLPNVIDRAGPQSKPSPSSRDSPLVTLVKGDVFDTTTIPPNCDTIIMKHFLDRCMWSEDETVQILRCCHAALSASSEAPTQATPKRVIIAEAILPDYGQVTSENQLSLCLDGMYSIVGRERQRTFREWTDLATTTGFVVESVHHTNVPSCSILVLRIKD